VNLRAKLLKDKVPENPSKKDARPAPVMPEEDEDLGPDDGKPPLSHVGLIGPWAI
jgi:hypothetical protein